MHLYPYKADYLGIRWAARRNVALSFLQMLFLGSKRCLEFKSLSSFDQLLRMEAPAIPRACWGDGISRRGYLGTLVLCSMSACLETLQDRSKLSTSSPHVAYLVTFAA